MMKAVRSFAAQGVLNYPSRSEGLACSATLTTYDEGVVALTCATPPSTAMAHEWLDGLVGPMPSPSTFEGTTTTGEKLLVTGPFIGHPLGWNAATGAKARFVLTGPARA